MLNNPGSRNSAITRTENFLVLDRVGKSFGGFVAVSDASMAVTSGEFIALMGPSGCGKTTTLRMIAGLEQPSGGEIRIAGKRMNDLRPWQRDTPLVWQSLALFPFLSVVENVEFGLKMRGIAKHERRRKAMQWLERLGIDALAQRDVKQISGGQQQRVALARALVTEPEILLLDEPLSALDAHLRVRMQSELSRLQQELGITFVYVTHAQSEAFAMANRMVIMSGGEIQQIGKPLEVYRSPANRFVAEFIGMNNILSGSVLKATGGQLTIGTRHGVLTTPRAGGESFGKGTEIHVVVGADRVAVNKQAAGDENAVKAKIVGQEFVGSMITLFLELEDKTEFRVLKHQSELDGLPLNNGETLVLSWLPQHVYVLPR